MQHRVLSWKGARSIVCFSSTGPTGGASFREDRTPDGAPTTAVTNVGEGALNRSFRVIILSTPGETKTLSRAKRAGYQAQDVSEATKLKRNTHTSLRTEAQLQSTGDTKCSRRQTQNRCQLFVGQTQTESSDEHQEMAA